MSQVWNTKCKEREKIYCKFFGNALRAFRKSTGKSVRLFAYENDIPQATLSRVERGDNVVQLITLKKISEGFGLPLSELIKYIEEKIPQDFKILDDENY